MQYGFSPPVSGPLSTPDNLARIAVEGEAIGYDYATISDHVVIPRDIEAKYPYSDTGEFPGRSRGDRHEQLTAVAFVAGKTSRLRLVTSVTVVPHRPAVLLAKMLATIDVLSKGRLTFGIGAGWMKEEFEALGVPPFPERGAVTDEYLNACRELWTKDDPRFEGRYVKFANILFEPKPVQKPHPPIWVGGESGPALRRTARLGDGWYPIGTNPQHRLDSMKRFHGRGRAAAPTDPRGGPRPGENGARLSRHRLGQIAAGSCRRRRAAAVLRRDGGRHRRSAGVPRFRRRLCRFQFRRRYRRRDDRRDAALSRGRARQSLGKEQALLKLGYKASAEQFGPRELLEFSCLAEAVGFDSVFVSDHFQPWKHTDGHAPLSFSWLGALGASTTRVQLGTSVATPTFRYHPSVVAQAFGTFGAMFPGRVVLGVGTGESLNEVPATGMEWPGAKERRDRLREAVR